MIALQGNIDCSPEETGYDSSRLEALDEHFQRLIDKEVIVGAEYAISHKGKVIANASIGGRSKISEDRMNPDTIFEIASITKTFTTVAIMQLVEKGFIRLDTYVGDILPQFSEQPFKYISIWNLLTHTSGIYPDGGCYPETAPKSHWEFVEEAAKKWDGKGEFDWIRAGISGGLRKEIGTQWMYSSFCFLILGEIITKVSGQFANDYIVDNIIKPLSMTDTSFDITKEMAPRVYIFSEEHKKIMDAVANGATMRNDSIWSKLPGTGGGLNSTTKDLLHFGNMMLGYGRFGDVTILGRKTVEQITTQQLHNIPDTCWGANEPDRKYGVGFDMRSGIAFSYSKGSYMHEGAGASSLYMDPQEQLCAAWFVPWNKVDWSADALFNVQNIIWSGLI